MDSELGYTMKLPYPGPNLDQTYMVVGQIWAKRLNIRY